MQVVHHAVGSGILVGDHLDAILYGSLEGVVEAIEAQLRARSVDLVGLSTLDVEFVGAFVLAFLLDAVVVGQCLVLLADVEGFVGLENDRHLNLTIVLWCDDVAGARCGTSVDSIARGVGSEALHRLVGHSSVEVGVVAIGESEGQRGHHVAQCIHHVDAFARLVCLAHLHGVCGLVAVLRQDALTDDERIACAAIAHNGDFSLAALSTHGQRIGGELCQRHKVFLVVGVDVLLNVNPIRQILELVVLFALIAFPCGESGQSGFIL